MNVDEIEQLLDLMQEHRLSELELEREGVRLRVKKAYDAASHSIDAPRAEPPVTVPAPTVTPTPTPEVAAESSDLTIVTSPIVGTFYRAPDPSEPPFVEVGDTVKKGQVVCIIEAMKLMNEIDSEYEGELVDVYVENGQPVQFGERLFGLRRA